jgi:hypothetical protein
MFLAMPSVYTRLTSFGVFNMTFCCGLHLYPPINASQAKLGWVPDCASLISHVHNVLILSESASVTRCVVKMCLCIHLLLEYMTTYKSNDVFSDLRNQQMEITAACNFRIWNLNVNFSFIHVQYDTKHVMENSCLFTYLRPSVTLLWGVVKFYVGNFF